MLNQNVLVTGSTGLIGRHVVTSLVQAGWSVHGCARSLRDPPKGDVRWHRANLLCADDRSRLLDAVRPCTIVHCAWETEHGAYWTSPQNLNWVGSSLALAREARERGAVRFVGVGSCAEYTWGGDKPSSAGQAPLESTTLYGIAKDATRRVLESYAGQSGLSFAWARVFMLYGAGEHPHRFVASLARALMRGESARMSSGRAIRDFLDARDVGAAIAAVVASPLTGAIDIGSGIPISLRQVGESLARLAGKRELLAVGALPDRGDAAMTVAADVTRLSCEVRFSPSIPLEQGLMDALNYWRMEASR